MSARHRSRRQQCCRHALRRAWQRFGLALSVGELEALAIIARTGRGNIVRRDPDGSTVVETVVHDRLVYFVFNRRLDCVVTFLPRGWALRPVRGAA